MGRWEIKGRPRYAATPEELIRILRDPSADDLAVDLFDAMRLLQEGKRIGFGGGHAFHTTPSGVEWSIYVDWKENRCVAQKQKWIDD